MSDEERCSCGRRIVTTYGNSAQPLCSGCVHDVDECACAPLANVDADTADEALTIVRDLAYVPFTTLLHAMPAGSDRTRYCILCGCEADLAEEPSYHGVGCVWRRAKRLYPDARSVIRERQQRMGERLRGVNLRERITW